MRLNGKQNVLIMSIIIINWIVEENVVKTKQNQALEL